MPTVVIWAEFTADGCVIYGKLYGVPEVVSRRVSWAFLTKKGISAAVKDVTDAVLASNTKQQKGA